MPNDLSSPKRSAQTRVSCVLTVTAFCQLTPNMIRVTLTGPDLCHIPANAAGGHCKIMLPEAGQSAEGLARAMEHGPKPIKRTYTIRHARPDVQEIDIDFVDHGDAGPASAWAVRVKPGDILGFSGPGSPKLTEFDADFYLIAADMSALPVAAAALEAMPRDAIGIAIFEVTSVEDRQNIDAPPGVSLRWFVHAEPHEASQQQIDMIRDLQMPEGRIKTLIAGETGVVRGLRMLLRGERGLPRQDVYASGYWRIGLAEDAHQKVKNQEVAEDEAKLAG